MRLWFFASCLLLAGPAMAADDWAVHGQATFVDQYHPAFHSSCRGPNSLDPGSRGNETVDMTLYAVLETYYDA